MSIRDKIEKTVLSIIGTKCKDSKKERKRRKNK